MPRGLRGGSDTCLLEYACDSTFTAGNCTTPCLLEDIEYSYIIMWCCREDRKIETTVKSSVKEEEYSMDEVPTRDGL